MVNTRPSTAYRELTQADYVLPRIVLAASGTGAAVGFSELCHYFSEWADVKAVATRSALHFIDTASLPDDVALYTDDDELSSWKILGNDMLHLQLRKWAEILVIAPLSANTLGKIAGGLCDDLLTCLVRSWDYSKPMFVAPDMHPSMWSTNLTERQINELDDLGVLLIPPVTSRPPNGDCGTGAMGTPSYINSTVKDFFRSREQ